MISKPQIATVIGIANQYPELPNTANISKISPPA